MRLFIAVNFPPEIKQKFAEYEKMLKTDAEGNFTKTDHLHMTLAFIGETDRTKDVKAAMDETASEESLDLTLNALGRFKRPGESLVWAGGASETLEKRQRLLTAALIKRGFDVDQRKWSPHVTLGRRVKFSKLKKDAEIDAYLNAYDVDLTVRFDGVSLMSSERIGGELIYREIYKTA